MSSLLRDPLKNPSFEWGETFCTMIDNRIRIYRDSSFDIVNPVLTYYRKPVLIEVGLCKSIYWFSKYSNVSEFKDDLVEVILDDTAH